MFEVHCNGFRVCWSLFGVLAVIAYVRYRNRGYTVLRVLGYKIFTSS